MNLLSNSTAQGRLTARRPQPRAAAYSAAGIPFSIAALALLWLTSAVAIGEFSLAFFVPFVVAAWMAMRSERPLAISAALHGRSGSGLWIECLCVVAILLGATLSSAVSPEPHRAFRVILPMLYGLSAILVFAALPSRQSRRVVYALLAAGALVMAFALIASRIPAMRPSVVLGYRFTGFFDNANQLSLVVISLLPLSLALLLTAQRRTPWLLCLAATLILFSALLLTGAKTALGIALVSTGLVYLYHSSRSDRLLQTLVGLGAAAVGAVIAIAGTLWLISWLNPIAHEKIVVILTDGVNNYQSIESRMLLWEESWRLGTENPIYGTGAGSHIYGVSHSHNLILDYFRGLGLVGAVAVLTLSLLVVVRAGAFFASTFGRGSDGKVIETITAALYLGAAGYIIGNQLSDSLSPSTAFFFWLVYAAAFASSEAVARQRNSDRFRFRAYSPVAIGHS